MTDKEKLDWLMDNMGFVIQAVKQLQGDTDYDDDDEEIRLESELRGHKVDANVQGVFETIYSQLDALDTTLTLADSILCGSNGDSGFVDGLILDRVMNHVIECKHDVRSFLDEL